MIVVAFVIAAVATPPDIMSQFMLALPLILLFEGSLFVMWILNRNADKVEGGDESSEGQTPA